MSTTYTVGVKVDGNVSQYLTATRQAEQATRSFGKTAKAEFDKLRQAWGSYQGQLATLGLSAGMVQTAKNAALLEKTLTQVRLTAGMSAQEQTDAYRNMFALVRANGGVIEETVGGFNNLIQAGLKYQEAMKATEAISVAKAVTGASDQALSGGLTVGAANFGFDLAKAGVAKQMLDEMTVAGRLGNAELQNLSDIFSRVAQRAQTAGMSFQTTLAFIEGMSQIERQPERLATLVDSTMRLFTNAHYAKDSEQATGVKFFNKDGSRRDSVAVLEELRTKYQKLTTDAQKFSFVSKAFGKADLDTQRGIAALLGGKGLENIREFEQQIKRAGGTLDGDLKTAINNAADQSSRLKNTLREAAEGFARPVNDALSRSIKYMLDSKKDGGMGLSGGQIAAGGAAAAMGAYMLSRRLPSYMQAFTGRVGGMAAGVATGAALHAAAGVTPVYVVNWSEMGGGTANGVPALPSVGDGSKGGFKEMGKLILRDGAITFAAYEVLRLVEASVQLYNAKNHEGVKFKEEQQRRIEKGEVKDFDKQEESRRTGVSVMRLKDRRSDVADMLRNDLLKGEIVVTVKSALGMSTDVSLSSSNSSVPLKSALGQTNMGAGG